MALKRDVTHIKIISFVPPHINNRYIDSYTSEKQRLPGFFRDSRHQEARQMRHKMLKHNMAEAQSTELTIEGPLSSSALSFIGGVHISAKGAACPKFIRFG
jgi:hypothetical protein